MATPAQNNRTHRRRPAAAIAFVPFAALAAGACACAQAPAAPAAETAPISARGGDALAAEALSWIGGPAYRVGGADLRTAIDAPRFVLSVYDRTGLSLPGGAPLANMERFGRVVHWRAAGSVTVAGSERSLPEPAAKDALRRGDRLVFEYPAGAPLVDKQLGPDRRTVGIYIGRYRGIAHAFVHASFKRGTVVVDDLEDPEFWAAYRFALRGAEERVPAPSGTAGLVARSAAPTGEGVRFDDAARAVTAAVGMGDYRADSLRLPSAAGDAARVARALESLYVAAPRTNPATTLVTDARGALDARALLDGVGAACVQAASDDLLVIYLSARGDGAGALLPSVSRAAAQNAAEGGVTTLTGLAAGDAAAATSVPLDAVAAQVAASGAKRALIVLDGPRAAFPPSALETLRASGKDIVLCEAAGPGQEARSDRYGAEEPRGVFTHNLLRGLKGAADAGNDGQVTVEELRRFVSDTVKADTLSAQTPSVVTFGAAGDRTVLVAPPRAAEKYERRAREERALRADRDKAAAAAAEAARAAAARLASEAPARLAARVAAAKGTPAPVAPAAPAAPKSVAAPKPAPAVRLTVGRVVTAAVGVSQYPKMAQRSLAGAAEDAERFQRTIAAMAAGRLDARASVGRTGNVSRADALTAVSAAAARAGAADVLAVYVTGLAASGGLLPSDVTDASGRKGALPPSALLDRALRSPAARLVLVWDTSFGTLSDADRRKLAGSGKDILLVFASGKDQQAFSQSPSTSGGGDTSLLLTFLGRALTGGDADTDRDGETTVGELRAYLIARVAQESDGRQTPTVLTFGKMSDATPITTAADAGKGVNP